MSDNNRVFISYASEDLEVIVRLNDILRDNGINTWLDKQKLKAGVLWDKDIQQAIRKCRFFIACISRNSIDKQGYVLKEFQQALVELNSRSSSEFTLLPCRIETTEIPNISVGFKKLSDYQLFDIKTEEDMVSLAKYIKNLINSEADVDLKKIQEIKRIIGKGDIKKAIHLLSQIISQKDSEASHRLTLLSGRFFDLQDQLDQGYITIEQASSLKNRIRASLLLFVDSMIPITRVAE